MQPQQDAKNKGLAGPGCEDDSTKHAASSGAFHSTSEPPEHIWGTELASGAHCLKEKLQPRCSIKVRKTKSVQGTVACVGWWENLVWFSPEWMAQRWPFGKH